MGTLKDINYGIGKYLEVSDASDLPDIGTNRTNIDLLNFKVATNNAYALYNFKDGMIDAYMSEAGVDTSASTDETYDSVGKYYSGFASITETYDAYINGYCASSGSSGGHIPSFSGTNNRRCTFGGGTGTSSFISANVSGANSGIFTLEMTIVQRGGGNGPSCFAPGVVKDTCSSTAGWPPTSAYGAYNLTGAGSIVGTVLKLVYDTSDPNVMTTYFDGGSEQTTIDEAGANWLSTGTPTTLYFLFPCWSDNATPWIWDLAGTREYTVYNDMTLISNAQTAQAAPTEGRLMIYEETSTGSTTLDTDLKGYVSRDGGTTYTQTPLVEDTVYEAFNQGGIDSNTKLMLHCDGSNGGTTFTDSSDSAHTITVSGNTHTDTAIKKFGTASAQFDGTGDYLSCPYSTDFDFGTSSFTLDTWVYLDNVNTNHQLIATGNSNWNGKLSWTFDVNSSTAKLRFHMNNASNTQFNLLGNTAIAVSTWTHVAFVRNGNTGTIYVNGVADATTDMSSWTSFVLATDNYVDLGHAGHGAHLTGYLDEVRISKGVARWTADFVPATRLSVAYDAGTYTTGPKRLLSGSVDISGQPAGTSMRYKIETLNQSDSKVCRIHGASMLWA